MSTGQRPLQDAGGAIADARCGETETYDMVGVGGAWWRGEERSGNEQWETAQLRDDKKQC